MYILDKLENDGSLSIIDAWKKFTIFYSVKHIGISHRKIKKSTLYAFWEAVWPDVDENINLTVSLDQKYSDIIELAHTIGGEGFDDLAQREMEDQELNNDDLIEFVNKVSENDVETDIDVKDEPNPFTAKFVRKGLAIGKKLGNYFQQHDPNVERALRFQRAINESLNQYEEVYKDLTKNKSQLLITDFLLS